MSTRGRPKKYRIVHHDPKVIQFSPRGKPGRPFETYLNVDEFESIHLSDFMGLSQKQGAELMRVSQQTFSRILNKARRLVAEAIVEGRIIKIQGGSYVISHKEDVKG